MKLFSVYHETYKPSIGACPLYDGLFLVSAASAWAATEIVREQMGASYNDSYVQELKTDYGVVLEFWRTVPNRPPARRNAQQKQEAQPLAEELAA